MLYELNEILKIGDENCFAVPAFNVYTMENVLGVLNAAEEMGSPVIFQMYSRLFGTQVGKYLAPVILEAIHNLKTPAAFHIDHGTGEDVIIRAIKYGASGAMIDASTLPFDKNIETTKRVVEMASAAGVGVEGELGHIGSTAEEISSEYTNVSDAVEFVEKTGVKALAVMVGTAHGRYKQTPKLAIDRIAEIHAAVPAHLVLHGGSGVPDDQIKMAINAGIRKINFATDLAHAFIDGCRELDAKQYPLDVYLAHPTQKVKEFAMSKIKLCGSDKY